MDCLLANCRGTNTTAPFANAELPLPACSGEKVKGAAIRQAGDVLMWDNATMLHRRDPVGQRSRLLKRTTIALPAQWHVIPEGALLEAPAG
jgi:hypothetical protein